MKKLTIYFALVLLLVNSNIAIATEIRQYHFDKPPFIHPAIIEDLTTWESDKGDQVISIDINHSNNSNRYFGEYHITQTEYGNKDMYHNSGNPYISVSRVDACNIGSDGKSPSFGYDLVGKINDIYVLHTSEGTCGSGVWHNLILVKLEQDIGISYVKSIGKLEFSNTRNIIRKLIEIPLGDRYEGYVKINENKIYVSKDERKSSIIKQDTVIELEGEK